MKEAAREHYKVYKRKVNFLRYMMRKLGFFAASTDLNSEGTRSESSPRSAEDGYLVQKRSKIGSSFGLGTFAL